MLSPQGSESAFIGRDLSEKKQDNPNTQSSVRRFPEVLMIIVVCLTLTNKYTHVAEFSDCRSQTQHRQQRTRACFELTNPLSFLVSGRSYSSSSRAFLLCLFSGPTSCFPLPLLLLLLLLPRFRPLQNKEGWTNSNTRRTIINWVFEDGWRDGGNCLVFIVLGNKVISATTTVDVSCPISQKKINTTNRASEIHQQSAKCRHYHQTKSNKSLQYFGTIYSTYRCPRP